MLCSDDLLYPGCLARQAAALTAHPRAGIVAARRDIIDTDGRVVFHDRGLAGLRGAVAGQRALERMVAIGTTPFGEPSVVLFRAEALREAGPFRDDYATLADVDRYAEVLRRWDCVAVDETLAAFRVNVGSWSDRSHRVQGRNLRRLLDDLAADPALALPRTVLWRGRLWSYVRAPARGLVFRPPSGGPGGGADPGTCTGRRPYGRPPVQLRGSRQLGLALARDEGVDEVEGEVAVADGHLGGVGGEQHLRRARGHA